MLFFSLSVVVVLSSWLLFLLFSEGELPLPLLLTGQRQVRFEEPSLIILTARDPLLLLFIVGAIPMRALPASAFPGKPALLAFFDAACLGGGISSFLPVAGSVPDGASSESPRNIFFPSLGRFKFFLDHD